MTTADINEYLFIINNVLVFLNLIFLIIVIFYLRKIKKRSKNILFISTKIKENVKLLNYQKDKIKDLTKHLLLSFYILTFLKKLKTFNTN